MTRFGSWWWGIVVCGSLLLGSALAALFGDSQERPVAAQPLGKPGYYQLHTEKLQDGTFCVIVINQGKPAMACDFTCRSPEGNLCE